MAQRVALIRWRSHTDLPRSPSAARPIACMSELRPGRPYTDESKVNLHLTIQRIGRFT